MGAFREGLWAGYWVKSHFMRIRRSATTSEPHVTFASIQEFTEARTAVEGWFSVTHRNRPVDFQFRDSPSDTLVVVFHGAAQRTVSLPWFTGRGVLDGVPAKWLAVSDASLLISDRLNLSWFAGSHEQPDLQDVTALVIDAVKLKSGAKHLIFFGSSGGAFAALETSRRFPDSLVIAMNPQTSIGKYLQKAVARYLEVAWSTESIADPALDGVTHDLTTVYERDHLNTVAYIQNTRDGFHIQNHQRPFLKEVSGSDKLWRLEGAWGDPAKSGHVIPPKDTVSSIVRSAVASDGNWGQALSDAGFLNDVAASAS